MHEVVRAFNRTFAVTEWGDPILKTAFESRSLAENLWSSLGYHPLDSIDFQTFIEPGGLADNFLHNQTYTRYVGGSDGF